MSKRRYGSLALPAAGAFAAGCSLCNAVKHDRIGAKHLTRGCTRAHGRAPSSMENG